MIIGFRVESRSTPESMITFDWYVKKRYMLLEKFSGKWVTSTSNCFVPYNEVKNFNRVPSVVGWSLVYHVLDFTLKSINNNQKIGSRLDRSV